MLHLAHPIPADDALLMSDDERRAFLTPRVRPSNAYISDNRTNRTGYIGVSQYGPRYGARIWHQGRDCFLGMFDTALIAAHAYDAKCRALRGELAILNFPEPTDADIDAAAQDPLRSVVEVFLPPDDSYLTEDLDPDCYGYGAPATEAETMAAPFDWDAMTEGAAA